MPQKKAFRSKRTGNTHRALSTWPKQELITKQAQTDLLPCINTVLLHLHTAFQSQGRPASQFKVERTGTYRCWVTWPRHIPEMQWSCNVKSSFFPRVPLPSHNTTESSRAWSSPFIYQRLDDEDGDITQFWQPPPKAKFACRVLKPQAMCVLRDVQY